MIRDLGSLKGTKTKDKDREKGEKDESKCRWLVVVCLQVCSDWSVHLPVCLFRCFA